MFLAAMPLSAVGTWLVRQWMRKRALGQTVRLDGPQTHLSKSGTPTLGGIGLLGAVALLMGGWGFFSQNSWSAALPLALALGLLYAALGFADDWAKLRYQRPLGLKARVRVPIEIVGAGLYAFLLVRLNIVTPAGGVAEIIPIGAGAGFVLFAIFVIVGASNAVNLTDGLDGLAGGVSCFCALSLGAACWLLGHVDWALLCAAVAGACAGFLWLNAHPASIFMGDVGSLGIGAILAAVAVATRLELLLALFGIVFVVEAMSVILQVIYFRWTGGRRIWRMAPYHHHLELCGWPETKIVTRFWLITIAAGALGISVVCWLISQG